MMLYLQKLNIRGISSALILIFVILFADTVNAVVVSVSNNTLQLDMGSADSFTNLQSQLSNSNSNNTLTITFDGATSLSCSSCPSGVTVNGTNTVIVDLSILTTFAGLAVNGTNNSNTITVGGSGIDLSFRTPGDGVISLSTAATINIGGPIRSSVDSTIAITTTGSGNIVVNDTVSAVVNGGDIYLTSAGSITSNGAAIEGYSGSLIAETGINVVNTSLSQGFYTITSTNGDIIVANQWQFDVPTINSTGNVSISSDQGLSFSNPISAIGTVTLTALGGDLQGVSLISSTSVIMVAQSGITQSGAMTVPGTSSFNAGNGVINLTNAVNDFTGAVSLTNTGTNNVAIWDVDDITLGVTSLGTGTFAVTGSNIKLNNNVTTTNKSQTYTGDVVVNANSGGQALVLSAGSGAISITGNIDSATGQNYSLTFTSTGDVTIGGTMGGTQPLGGLAITGNDISLGNIGGANVGTTSNVSVQASDGADNGSITLTGTTYNTTGQQFYNSSAVASAFDATRLITLTGGSASTTVSLTSATGIETYGTIQLNNRVLSLNTSSGSSGFVTNDSKLPSLQVFEGPGSVVLDTGASGPIVINGAIGTVGTPLNSMTITNAANADFTGSIHAENLTITDTTDAGIVNFQGDLTVDTGMTIAANGAYNVKMIGASNTIAGQTTFGNSGLIIFGDAGTDTFNFTGGIIATDPSEINLIGKVTAAGIGLITLGDSDTSINIKDGGGAVGGASTGTITLGNAILEDNVTLTVGTGIANTINMAAVTGTASAPSSNLILNTTGAVTVAGAVGTDIGTLTITNSGGTTFQSTVNAATTTITATTGTVAFQGNLTLGTSLVTAAQGYNVSITGTSNNIPGATSLLNTGMVTLGNGANDSTTFAGGLVITAPSSIAIQGTVATTNTTMTLGDAGTGVILGANTTLNAGAGNINLDGIVSGLFSLTPINSSPGLTTISGANSNTTTHVTTGVVQINNSTPQTTNFVVSGGALKGTGVIGNLTATGPGVIAPGNSPGKVTTTNLSLSSTNTLQIEITGSNLSPVAGTDYDQIVVSSGDTVTLGTAILTTLSTSFTGNAGTVFTIIDNQGPNPISGTFNGLAEGAVISENGNYFKISYVGGTGNDVTLTAVLLPVITAIYPTFGPTSGGSPITITGSNLTGATGITIDSATCSSFVVVSATSATCTTPAGSAGTASVIVTTPSGINSANTLFTYVGAPTATTGSASSITTNGAILGGLVSSNGASTTVNFNYGLTTSYGSSVIAVESPLSLSANSASVSALLSGLECNKTYHFQVTANNGTITNGNDATFVTSNCDSTSVPSSLMIVSASPLDAKAVVNWTAPDDGGSVITGYTVTSSPDSKTCATTGNPAPTSCTVSSLTNGTSYTFTVTATNSVGTSAASLPSNTVTPTDKNMKPAIPGVPIAAPGDQQATVSWDQVLTGGDPELYLVTANPSGQTCTKPFPGRAFASAACTITGLTNGKAYTFTVTATNGVGSADSIASTPVIPLSIINGACGSSDTLASLVEPISFLCDAGEASAVDADQGIYRWQCSGSNGGSSAECLAPGLKQTDSIGTSTFTTPAENGCAIQRVNQVLPINNGPGAGITMPYNVIDFEMTGCQASLATVKMTYSNIVEGMAFWKYIRGNWLELTHANSGLIVEGNIVTFTIEDNGPYDADPAIGSIADPSGPAYVAFPAVPGIPSAPKAVAGDSLAAVSWQAPENGGAAVRYTVTSAPENQTCTVLAPLTTCVVAGLANNQSYTFTVIAENAGGTGGVSAVSNVVKLNTAVNATSCGEAYGLASLLAPENDLCPLGAKSSFLTTQKGQHRWACTAIDTGVSSSCVAPGATLRGSKVSTTFSLVSGAGCIIESAKLKKAPAGLPLGVKLPYGVVSFALNNCQADSATLSQTFSTSINKMVLWKWLHQSWITLPDTLMTGNTVTFSLQDNGPYDSNPIQGEIVDPVGIGTSNKKATQSVLQLSVSNTEATSRQTVQLITSGGSGKGKIHYAVQASTDTHCVINRDNLKVTISGNKVGTCKAWAIKNADETYNATVSNPVTISVQAGKPPSSITQK